MERHIVKWKKVQKSMFGPMPFLMKEIYTLIYMPRKNQEEYTKAY